MKLIGLEELELAADPTMLNRRVDSVTTCGDAKKIVGRAV